MGYYSAIKMNKPSAYARLHTVYSIYMTLTKLEKWKKYLFSQGLGMRVGDSLGKGGGCTWKGATGRFLRDRAVVYLDCINILIPILCYSFARCYNWRKLAGNEVGALCITS